MQSSTGIAPAPTLRERISGAFWGHLVGDALGLPYEGTPRELMREVRWGDQGAHGQPAGTWSDDGGLMLALLDSLLSTGFDLHDQAHRALAWMDGPDYKPGPRVDIGRTTRSALGRLKQGIAPELAGGASVDEISNGSLMRILPVALVGLHEPPATVAEWACRAGSLTHRHPRAQAACAAYSLLVRQLLLGERDREETLLRALSEAEACLPAPMRQELDELRVFTQRSGTGYVLDTFWSAWEAFHASDSYAATVERAILYGEDTDTTACVAGGLAGAYWGITSIPARWLRGMRGQEIAERLLRRLLDRLAL